MAIWKLAEEIQEAHDERFSDAAKTPAFIGTRFSLEKEEKRIFDLSERLHRETKPDPNKLIQLLQSRESLERRIHICTKSVDFHTDMMNSVRHIMIIKLQKLLDNVTKSLSEYGNINITLPKQDGQKEKNILIIQLIYAVIGILQCKDQFLAEDILPLRKDLFSLVNWYDDVDLSRNVFDKQHFDISTNTFSRFIIEEYGLKMIECPLCGKMTIAEVRHCIMCGGTIHE
ncbi:MAG: hypothetical protein NTV44_06630 [Firmicutes bacterium]|nr:hypothetical protein [Bacillota bacterium]